MIKHKTVFMIILLLGFPIFLSGISSAASDTTLMSIAIAGNPYKAPAGNSYSGYGYAYDFPNYTSIMPEWDIWNVISPGNSTFSIVYASGPVIVPLTSFNNSASGNMTLKTGMYDIIVTISSSQLGKSRTIIYSIQVLTLVQYINYANQKKTATVVVNPLPPWQEMAAGAAEIGAVILLLVRPTRGFYRAWKNGKGLPSDEDLIREKEI